jgi:hypothetical protein
MIIENPMGTCSRINENNATRPKPPIASALILCSPV